MFVFDSVPSFVHQSFPVQHKKSLMPTLFDKQKALIKLIKAVQYRKIGDVQRYLNDDTIDVNWWCYWFRLTALHNEAC